MIEFFRDNISLNMRRLEEKQMEKIGLAGAQSNYLYQDSKCYLFINELELFGYSICLYQMEIRENMRLTIRRSEQSVELVLPFMPISFRYPDKTTHYLDSFVPLIRYLPEGEWDHCFDKDQSVAFLCLSVRESVVQELLFGFQALQALLSAMRDKRSFYIGPNQALRLDQSVLLTIKEILHCSFKGEVRNLYLTAALKGFFIKCFPICSQPAQKGSIKDPYIARQEDKVRQIVHLLAEKPETRLSIKELSQLFHTNSEVVKKGLHGLLGQGYRKFRKETRMLKSVQLLLFSDKRGSEIADELGYSNADEFSCAFQSYFGMSVKQFVTV
jgi:AraC-like DNA-binding protein